MDVVNCNSFWTSRLEQLEQLLFWTQYLGLLEDVKKSVGCKGTEKTLPPPRQGYVRARCKGCSQQNWPDKRGSMATNRLVTGENIPAGC